MIAAKIAFTGVLYGSFMKTDSGELKVIEYNCRPGDSEWINLVMLLDIDISDGLITFGSSHAAESEFQGSSIRFRKEASLCTYIVDADYAKSVTTEDSCHTENYFTLDSACSLGAGGYFAANATLESISESRNRSLFSGVLRYKYKYTKPGRLMAVCATGSDTEELIDIHNSMCQMVKGARLDWRRDIPAYIHIAPSPLSSQSGTPRLSYCQIEPSSGGQETEKAAYISHLDNYNKIMDDVKIDIEAVNKRIIDNINSVSGGSSHANNKLELTGEIGDFANSIRARGMTLICSVDGAGTKTKFMAEHPNRFRVLGHDVIIHNINDMLCNGGTPVAFLDYYGCDRLDPCEFSEYIHGILEVCESEGIPLIGGETAEMRGIYQPGECEVLGILLGMALNGTRNGGDERVSHGTLIYGIRSHGAHTNGFTKLREIQSQHPMPADVYEYFCRPHRNYRPVFEALASAGIHPVAKAHITGGGFTDNLMRVVSKDQINKLRPRLEPWSLSREWEWVLKHSGMQCEEFTRVFNAGFGMCFMVNEPIDYTHLPAELSMDIQLLGAFMNSAI
jgi:phosphoribosylformylglycinamidine cyclo-ligase